MTIPKWLLPVIAVVAALAVGVALTIVGAQFASKQTKEVVAKTATLPVIAPAARGLTSDQVKSLLASKTRLVSPKVGNQTVSEPGTLPSTTPLQREVEVIANSGDSADGSATSSPTPTPGLLVVPYVPSPGATADDPCAPVDTKIPIGCPSGLRSAIFADSTPPPLRVSASPFTSPCNTAPTPSATSGRVDAEVLISTTQPATIDVHYWAPTVPPAEDGWHQLTGVTPNGDSVNAYNVASEADTPTDQLPLVSTCVKLTGVLPSTAYRFAVTVHGATEDFGPRTFTFNTTGAPTDQPMHVTTYGNGGLIVSGDYRDDEQFGVRAFIESFAISATCQYASGNLPEVQPVGLHSGPMTPLGDRQNDEPTDITQRKAYGFEVPAGSQVLLCGKWWHGTSAPSWDRITPIRTDSAIAQAPDAILPYIRVGGWPTIDDPGVNTVAVSISTAEGVYCGSAVIYRHDIAVYPDGGADVCDIENSGSRVSPLYHYITNAGFSGNFVATVTVTYDDGHVGTSQNVIDDAEDAPTVCNPHDPADICGHIQDVFEVDIPYYPLPNHPDPNDGVMDVVVGWNGFGDSGLSTWQVHTEDLQIAPDPANPATLAPLMNTDHRVTTSTTDSPDYVTANLDLQSNTGATYSMHLTAIDGPGCAVGGASLTAHGHVGNETTVSIPGLCFGTQYFASVTLSNSHGLTTWGHDAPEAGWLGYFFSTPNKLVTISVAETVETTGKVQYIDATLGGQELTPGVDRTTCWEGITHVAADTVTLRLPTTTSLHIEYRMPPTGGDCSTYDHEVDNPLTEENIPIDLNVLARSGSGQIYTEGPVSVKIAVVPAT